MVGESKSSMWIVGVVIVVGVVIIGSIGVLYMLGNQPSNNSVENGDIITDSDGDGYNDDVDAFPNDRNEWKDSDSDGYGDNGDDFPLDSNFHKKTIIIDFNNYLFKAGKSKFLDREIRSDIKYIEWEWTTTSSIWKFTVYNYDTATSIFEEEYTSHDMRRIWIDESNFGTWSFGWYNFDYSYPGGFKEAQDELLNIEIYTVE